jgi:hypothetical protein
MLAELALTRAKEIEARVVAAVRACLQLPAAEVRVHYRTSAQVERQVCSSDL